MQSTQQSFACAECGSGMERVSDVPVLESLAGHAVHRCGECGHILLVQERAGKWSLGWLNSLDCGATISCAEFV